MSFGIIILNQNISTMQNYATRIQEALSFILEIKDIYEDIPNDVAKRFHTSNYEIKRRKKLPKKSKKVIGLMEDILGRKIMAKFVGHILTY